MALAVLVAGAFSLSALGCARLPVALWPSPAPTASPTATVTPSPTATATSTPSPTPPPTATPSPTPNAIEALLARMTLEEKVGQMLMVGLPGPTLDRGARHAVLDLHAGGVTLLAHNADSPEQVARLLDGLRKLSAVPLFVSINHEGGEIVRVQQGVTVFPDNMALGAAGSPELAYAIGRAGGEELAAMGINMNFAPVVDVNTEPRNPVIGLRSFGAQPDEVGELGAQFIRGTQEAGVIAVAKHFPGHGGVAVDSHLALPLQLAPADVLWAVDLPPFQRAIDAGVEAIMSAHLAVPALSGDQGLPATLSRAVMTDLLRGRLGFRGLIITDDLDMKGITSQMSQAEAAVRAVEAGADVILVVHTPQQDATYAALLQAVRGGRLSQARIDESVRRILALKARYGLFDPPPRSLAGIGGPEHRELARRACEAAVTLVDGAGLPLPAEQRVLVVSPRSLPAGEGGTLFCQAVARRAAETREVLYQPYSPQDQKRALTEALQLAPGFDRIVVGLWDATLQQAGMGDATPFQMVQELAATGVPVTAIAWRLPYDLGTLSPGVGALATFGADPPEMIEAAAAALFGEQEARGVLPVPLR